MVKIFLMMWINMEARMVPPISKYKIVNTELNPYVSVPV